MTFLKHSEREAAPEPLWQPKQVKTPGRFNALVPSPVVKCQDLRRENVFSCAQKGFDLSDHNFRLSIVLSFPLSFSLPTAWYHLFQILPVFVGMQLIGLEGG